MPALATVATSGSYSDLSNKPTVADYINIVYPVGSYYETSDISFNPNVSWTGTWVEDTAGLVLVASDSGTFNTVGATGGEETHTLTVPEMPSHSHNVNLTGGDSPSATGRLQWTATTKQEFAGAVVATGGDGAHNNLQPYVVVKRWHRTA